MAQKKNIDAIAMTRRIRDANYERLRGLSRTERLAFYREQARLMDAQIVKLTMAKAPKRVHV